MLGAAANYTECHETWGSALCHCQLEWSSWEKTLLVRASPPLDTTLGHFHGSWKMITKINRLGSLGRLGPCGAQGQSPPGGGSSHPKTNITIFKSFCGPLLAAINNLPLFPMSRYNDISSQGWIIHALQCILQRHKHKHFRFFGNKSSYEKKMEIHHFYLGQISVPRQQSCTHPHKFITILWVNPSY